jgi:hypothetical protein
MFTVMRDARWMRMFVLLDFASFTNISIYIYIIHSLQVEN